jgi:FtsH-binding integral membrane protein
MKENLNQQHSAYNNIYGTCDNSQLNKNNNDIEMNQEEHMGLLNLQIRLGFIRKVYGILTMQMILTTFMCVLSMSIPAYAQFQLANPALFWISLVGTIILMIALTCFRQLSRKVPTNYILLGLFTMCEGYLVSFICSTTKPELVLMAALMTCAITIALTIYACTTKSDFTVLNSLLFTCSCIMLLFGIFLLFTHNKILYIIYSCFGVLLYSIYLVYDTQLIVGDKSRSLDIDDYIYASLILYIDIVHLFLHILRLLKASNN